MNQKRRINSQSLEHAQPEKGSGQKSFFQNCVPLDVGQHVHLHVSHHVSHHEGHHNVISTLCEGSETLTERISERNVFQYLGTYRGRC